MERRILIIEEDAELARQLATGLGEDGFAASAEGMAGLDLVRAARQSFDLLVLGKVLPAGDGLEICRQLRATGLALPIFIVGTRDTEIDRVLALEMGADDYLVKPLSLPALCARVKALFRRLDMTLAGAARDLIQFEGMRIDVARHEVMVEGKTVALTAKEFDLLSFLARHPGRVFTRGQLLSQVWGYGHEGYEHTVNSHVNRLRNKIEPDPANPQHILTVWSVGYKFRDRDGFSA